MKEMKGGFYQEDSEKEREEGQHACFYEELDGETSAAAAQYFPNAYFFCAPDGKGRGEIYKIDHG